jgi:EmrB/QacA subfamily drug resistance transporter
MTEHVGRRSAAVLAVVCAAQFLTILDPWVANIALPVLQRDFAPATLPQISWILDIYAIVVTALLIPAGRIADALGRHASFLAGLAVFGLASLGCALAPALPALIAFRALQAVGAAVLMPTSLGLALSAFPQHRRSTAVGVWAAVGAVAAGGGPVLGGLLVEWNWRWLFLINVPLILITMAAGRVVLPREDGAERGDRRIDYAGVLLALGAIGLVCTALTEIPVWPAVRTWGVLSLGLALAGAFVAHVRRHPDPVMKPRLFAIREFSTGAAGLVTYYVGFAAILLGTTLLLTRQWHFSAVQAALGIAPGPLAAGVLSPISGRLSGRFGKRNTVLAGAFLFAASGAWPLSTAGATPAYGKVILPSMLLWGLANALLQPSLFASAGAVPHADLASASAVLSMARQLGSALGVAVLVAVLGIGHTTSLAGFHRAWLVVLISAGMTGVSALGITARRTTTPNATTDDSETAIPALVPETGPAAHDADR